MNRTTNPPNCVGCHRRQSRYIYRSALSRLPADAGAFCTAEDRFGLVQQLPAENVPVFLSPFVFEFPAKGLIGCRGSYPARRNRRPAWESIRLLNPNHLRVSIATS